MIEVMFWIAVAATVMAICALINWGDGWKSEAEFQRLLKGHAKGAAESLSEDISRLSDIVIARDESINFLRESLQAKTAARVINGADALAWQERAVYWQGKAHATIKERDDAMAKARERSEALEFIASKADVEFRLLAEEAEGSRKWIADFVKKKNEPTVTIPEEAMPESRHEEG